MFLIGRRRKKTTTLSKQRNRFTSESLEPRNLLAADPAITELMADNDGFLLDEPFKAMAPFESPFVFSFAPILVAIAYLSPVEVSFSTGQYRLRAYWIE